MKTLRDNALKLVAFILPLFMVALAYAQEKVKLDVDVDKSGGNVWYGNPVVWVVGAAVFVLILVALLRGKSKD